jgi:hypothetical protein
MGSIGYNLGHINIQLTHNTDDPNYPPIKFNINGHDEWWDISLTLSHNGKTEVFNEFDPYPVKSLLGELFSLIEKEMEKKGLK